MCCGRPKAAVVSEGKWKTITLWRLVQTDPKLFIIEVVETTTDTQTHGHTQGRSTHASFEITQNQKRLTRTQSTSVDGTSWVYT